MKLFQLFLATTLITGTSSAQTLGVWVDSLETDCNIVAPYPGDPVTAYVIGTMDDGKGQTALGAQFRIDGLPAGWMSNVVSITPPPTLLIGDPFGDDGVTLNFSCCESEIRFVIVVDITPTSAASNVVLTPGPHPTAGEQACGFEGATCSPPCASFCTDNGFGLDCNCFEPFETSINGSACVVAVEERPWSEVKATFR